MHTRFSRWVATDVWERVFQHPAADADNEYAMIDSTIVPAHQHSAGAQKKAGEDQVIGRSRGGLSTKIHALVDALGNPVGFHLTGGEAHDLAGADQLLPSRYGYFPPFPKHVHESLLSVQRRVIAFLSHLALTHEFAFFRTAETGNRVVCGHGSARPDGLP